MSHQWNKNDFQDDNASRVAPTKRTAICFPFSGDTVGGSHLSVLGLLNRLDRSRYRVVVVPQFPEGRIGKLFASHEVEHRHGLAWAVFKPEERFTPGKFLKAIRRTRALAGFLRSHGIDIVHTNDGATHATWALAAHLAGARLVWHHRGDPKALGIRFVAPLLANQVMSVSDFALPRANWWRRRVPAQIVHSPFDTALTIDRAEARKQLLEDTGLPADAILIGFFGNLIDRKRPCLFVEAIARLRELLPGAPIHGLMFGTTSDARMQATISERIDDLGMEGCVLPMGWKSPGSFWIAACDTLMVPAVSEPFGRTLIEAMLVGTPVVATASGGNVEAIRDGENGLLVEPEDAGALAEGCARLIRDASFRAAIADRAADWARLHFSEEHHCQQVSAVYDRLVPAPRGSHG